jgi:Tol biopolymer transport system component
MALPAGTRLGPYEILSPLGAGGMGEVYRARDTRLAREVAIKVLPESLASDQERLKRFEKEARSASALNHPNIVTIHDIGSENGVSYIAMELVDGTTLRELLASGPLPIKKLLQIAPQIAEGLARAHEAGIVHRDLKPENVMVKKDGLVKILDFGLAKLSSTGSGSDEASQLPTMTGTQPGVVVGTVGYMSPEQASGQTVDFRSDQFSLGSMLYEMATGKRAFQRKTAIDTLAAILNDEPEPISMASPQTPIHLRWTIERCLAKESPGRYASTQDLARDLSTLRDHLSEATSSATIAAAADIGAGRRRIAVPALSAMAVAAVLIAAGLLAGRWLTARNYKTPIPTFSQLTVRRGIVHSARFAPDGKTVVYGAAWDGAPVEVFTVRTDSNDPRPIGLSGADALAVSSKGELAVLLKKAHLRSGGGGTLARMPLGGGTPRELLEDVWGADWAPNGEDLAVVVGLRDGKRQIQYPIGKVVARGEDLGETVRVSPSGDLIAFKDGNEIVTVARSGKRSVISRGWVDSGDPVWSPGGDELIFSGTRSGGGSSVFAVSLSGRERVLLSNAFSFPLRDVAPDGRLLMELLRVRGEDAVQPRGGNRELGLNGYWGSTVDISEDGSRVLSDQGDLGKTDGTPAIHLGDGKAQGLSADGKWALTLREGPPRELIMLPTGPGSTKKIPVQGLEPLEAWLIPGEKGFLVRAEGKDKNPVLAVVGPDGGKPSPLTVEGYVPDHRIVVSPTGDRIAYESKEGGLRIVPLSGGAATIVPGAPLDPNDKLVQWSADGRFLYVAREGDAPAPVDLIELETGRRRAWKTLMPADPIGVPSIFRICVSRDGQSYAYTPLRVLESNLFLVDGVK